MKILAFESTCDETAVAVVEDGRRILTDQIFSQAQLHAVYGGVVPEIASRCHVESISLLAQRAIEAAGITRADIDAAADMHVHDMDLLRMVALDQHFPVHFSLFQTVGLRDENHLIFRIFDRLFNVG